MKKFGTKALVITIAVMLAVCAIIGGTYAWLIDTTDSVENTFTFGNINIELEETTGDSYKLLPNAKIEKDPKVTVKADSEACWLFVQVEETGNLSAYADYAIASDWTELQAGVYYIKQDATAADVSYSVLANDEIVVKDLTKTQIDGITADPTLTVTAFAIQQEGIADAATAWSTIQQNLPTNP